MKILRNSFLGGIGLILSIVISAAFLSACNSDGVQNSSEEPSDLVSENYTTGSYQIYLSESLAERGSEETEASESENIETEELEAQTAFLNFLSGNVSLLEDQELGQEWTNFYLPNSELEYVFMDLDGDDVSELILQYADEPGSLNGVFNYENGKLICWNFDSAEMSSRDYPLRDGTMVHQYDYSGTRSYTVFRYLPDGTQEEIFNLFARDELIYEEDPIPVPYYEIDGQEVEQAEFDAELENRITNQFPERSAWTPVRNSHS